MILSSILKITEVRDIGQGYWDIVEARGSMSFLENGAIIC